MLRLPLAAAAAASLFSIQLSLNAIGPPENSADAHSLRRTRSFTLKLELWHWGGCAATRVRLRAQRVRGSTCLTHEALEQIPLPAKRRLARFFVFRSVLGRVFRRFLRRLFFFDGKQLHFKDQCGVGPDLRTRLARSVGPFGRHKELPLRSDGHQLPHYRPSLDDLVYREAG